MRKAIYLSTAFLTFSPLNLLATDDDKSVSSLESDDSSQQGNETRLEKFEKRFNDADPISIDRIEKKIREKFSSKKKIEKFKCALHIVAKETKSIDDEKLQSFTIEFVKDHLFGTELIKLQISNQQAQVFHEESEGLLKSESTEIEIRYDRYSEVLFMKQKNGEKYSYAYIVAEEITPALVLFGWKDKAENP